jgi:hypothetical protein
MLMISGGILSRELWRNLSARVTCPGGHVVLVVCPSNIRQVPIPNHILVQLTLCP